MLISPYGNQLIDCLIPADALDQRHAGAKSGAVIPLGHDDMINAVNLAVGCYSPLAGFVTEEAYLSVTREDKLPGGLDWTVPILLPVAEETGAALGEGEDAVLADETGKPVGVMQVTSLFEIGREDYASHVFGTTDTAHPGVRALEDKPTRCAGGPIHFLDGALPEMRHFRRPAEMRMVLESLDRKDHVAFSTRNICHLGHEHLHTISLEIMDVLGINVITGAGVPGNFLPDVVFDTYEHLMEAYYPEGRIVLNNLRLPPLFAGPKEAFLQAIMLQNYGFNHFIVGRDHAGTGGFYNNYASQEIFDRLDGLDIEIVRVSEQRYCTVCRKITTERSCRHGGDEIKKCNGRDVRHLLAEKEYHELSYFLRPDLQEIIIELLQTKVDLDGNEAGPVSNRQIFYS